MGLKGRETVLRDGGDSKGSEIPRCCPHREGDSSSRPHPSHGSRRAAITDPALATAAQRPEIAAVNSIMWLSKGAGHWEHVTFRCPAPPASTLALEPTQNHPILRVPPIQWEQETQWEAVQHLTPTSPKCQKRGGISVLHYLFGCCKIQLTPGCNPDTSSTHGDP